MPSATSTATRLPAAWVLPGLAKSDSPGEALISLRTAVGSAIGCAGGTAIPRPRATPCVSAGSMLTRIDPIRSRMGGTVTRVFGTVAAFVAEACAAGGSAARDRSTTRTGTAGWSVPRAAAENFPGEGSDL